MKLTPQEIFDMNGVQFAEFIAEEELPFEQLESKQIAPVEPPLPKQSGAIFSLWDELNGSREEKEVVAMEMKHDYLIQYKTEGGWKTATSLRQETEKTAIESGKDYRDIYRKVRVLVVDVDSPVVIWSAK